MNFKDLLKQTAPKKQLDQFFLLNEKILEKEVSLAELGKDDVVLEIGAGIGNLTEKIAKRCRVIAIEKDERFMPLLKKIKNAEIIEGDALDVLPSLKNFNKIISNIPYSRSQDIIVGLLQRRWEKAVLCVQAEFAEKMQQNTRIGTAVRDCCNFSVFGYIDAEEFYPKAVQSAIIALEQRKPLDMKFWRFLGMIYKKRNRDVKNVVKNAPSDLVKKKVHQLGIEEIRILHKMNS